jgi:hypothetical protein
MQARTVTRSRAFRLLIAAILATFVSILTLPGTAFASGGVTKFFQVPVSQHLSDGSLLAQLTQNQKVGDCTLFAGSGVRMSRPDVNGNVLVTWSAIGQTSHTNHADIWHLAVFSNVFGPASAPVSVGTSLMDGAPMTRTFTTYTWQRTTVAHIPAGTVLAAVTTTTWQSIC